VFPKSSVNDLVPQVLFFRDHEGGFQHNLFETFLAKLKQLSEAGYRSAYVTMAYIQEEIKVEHNPLYIQFARHRQFAAINERELQRAGDIDAKTFLLCASGAAKEVTFNLTDKLQGVRLSRGSTDEIIEIFEDAGDDYRSDKFIAAISIALKSDDPELTPYLIRGFQMRNPRYYGRIMRWLETTSTVDYVQDVEAIEPATPRKNWDRVKQQAISKMENRF
jgi:hypothetical protein